MVQGLPPHSFQPTFFSKTGRYLWVSGGFLERRIPGKNGPGVDSPFFSTKVLFKDRPLSLGFCRFSGKKDSWKEWSRGCLPILFNQRSFQRPADISGFLEVFWKEGFLERMVQGLTPHSFQPRFFSKTGRYLWVSGGFLERRIPGKNGPGVDSPFFSTNVLLKDRPLSLGFCRFSGKKDSWKEWSRG